MKIELNAFQMAVLAQVFARDIDALDEKIAVAYHEDVDYPIIERYDNRLLQAHELRAEINSQLSPADQREIVEVASSGVVS